MLNNKENKKKAESDLKIITFNHESVTYKITRKKIKNIIFKYRETIVHISAPFKVSEKYILTNFERLWPKIKQQSSHFKNSPKTEDYIYLFGRKYTSFDVRLVDYSENLLRELLLHYVTSRVREIEIKMGITFKSEVKVRKMRARLGSNQINQKILTFALVLVHYAPEIIDAVIYHELAHYRIGNHSKEFYQVLLSYYPEYHHYHRKIKQGIYQ